MMITNNYVSRSKTLFMYSCYSGSTYEKFVNILGTAFTGGSATCMTDDIGGNIKHGRTGELPTEVQTSSSSCSGGVYFGSGTTAPTRENYKLEAPITSGLSIVSTSTVAQEKDGNGKYWYMADHRVTNTGTEAVSIGEVGLFLPIGVGNNKFYPCLVERTVLDEPVVTEPGMSKVITYKITFNHPSGGD